VNDQINPADLPSTGVSPTASNEAGQADEKQFALPLTDGELYPLDIIPIPTHRVFNEELRSWEEIQIDCSNTLKSVLSEEHRGTRAYHYYC